MSDMVPIGHGPAEITKRGVITPDLASRKDIATLDEKLTAEIRRQTRYLLMALEALGRGGQEMAVINATLIDYIESCEEADKKP